MVKSNPQMIKVSEMETAWISLLLLQKELMKSNLTVLKKVMVVIVILLSLGDGLEMVMTGKISMQLLEICGLLKTKILLFSILLTHSLIPIL
jgi:hypothetical protein